MTKVLSTVISYSPGYVKDVHIPRYLQDLGVAFQHSPGHVKDLHIPRHLQDLGVAFQHGPGHVKNVHIRRHLHNLRILGLHFSMVLGTSKTCIPRASSKAVLLYTSFILDVTRMRYVTSGLLR